MSREGHPGPVGGNYRPNSTADVAAYNNNYVPGSQDYNRGQSKAVKYPPSMGGSGYQQYNHEGYSRPASQSIDMGSGSGSGSGGGSDSYRRGSSMTSYTVSDIIRQLEIATNDNDRLRRTIQENNDLFQSRCAEMQESSSEKGKEKELEKENKALKQQVSESTNRFCEARVAVLGFKCKVIQLTGELEKARAYGGVAGGGGGVAGGGGVVGGGGSKDDSLRVEHQQLQGSVQQLQDKLSECEKDKKEFARQSSRAKHDLVNVETQNRKLEEDMSKLSQEIHQLHYQLQEKDAHIQQLLINKSQYGGEQNQHDHTLRGQVEELSMKNRALESSVSNMKVANDDLIARNKKLEQNRDMMMEKLQRSADSVTATSPPVPKPRTTISGSDRERLEREIESFKEQVRQLQEERDRSDKSRGTLDGMFQDANRKSQTLKEEVVQKEQEVAAARRELSALQHQLEMNQQEKGQRERRMESLRRDLENVHKDMRSLEKEKQETVQQATLKEQDLREAVQDVEEMKRARDEARELARKYRSQVTDLEGRVSSSVDTGKPRTSTKPVMSAAHRLNEALGNIKRLEEDKVRLEECLAEEKEERGRESRKLKGRLELMEKELNTEREEVRRATETEVMRLQQDNEALREREQWMNQQLMELESSKSSSLDSLRSELQETQAVREQEKLQLTQQLEDKQTLLQRKESELEEVRAELSKRNTRTGNKLESLQTSYTDLKTRCRELDTSAKDKETQVEQLLRENEQCKNACEEYRKESESILQDYNTCAQRLKLAQDESSRWMREYTHQQDRVGLLEKNRTDLEEKLNHMDQQIKIFQEDYAREKEAREAAVKVRNLAEERMKRMKEELDDCRSKLNDQAAKLAPHEDPRMDPYYRSGGRYSDPSAASWHPATSTGSNRFNQPHSQQQDNSHVRPFPPSGGKSYSQQPGGWTQITTPSSTSTNYRPSRPMTSIAGHAVDHRLPSDYNSSSGGPSAGLTFGTGTGGSGMGVGSGYNTGPVRATGGRMGMSADGMDVGSNRVGSSTGILRASGGGRMINSADGVDIGSNRIGSNTGSKVDGRVGNGMGSGARVGAEGVMPPGGRTDTGPGLGGTGPRLGGTDPRLGGTGPGLGGPGPGLGGPGPGLGSTGPRLGGTDPRLGGTGPGLGGTGPGLGGPGPGLVGTGPRLGGTGPGFGGPGAGDGAVRSSREHIQQTSKEGESPTKNYKAATNEDKITPPHTPCPMCGRSDFKSQIDLEVHSANCSGIN